MELDFLTKQQSLDFFNKKTGLNIDVRTFLIYCLECEVPIKYKVLTKFVAIKGFNISLDELEQLKTHMNLDVGEIDSTIYAQDNFSQQSSELCFKYCKENFEQEYYSLPLNKLKALAKSSELMYETDEYVKLLEKKDYIDRVERIKNREKILSVGERHFVFHPDNEIYLDAGIYEFLDSSLTSGSTLRDEISDPFLNDGSSLNFNSRFLKINNDFYYKSNELNNDYFYGLRGEKEIFQQGILRIDIENLIKKLSGKDAKTDMDILHTRTANNASKIISALCELNGLDITKPFSDANKTIMETLERLDAPLSKDVIGEWLKLAHENTK